MKNRKITEATSGALGKIEGKRRWFTRIIAAGAGSSGYHTTEALESTGASAWPVGTKVNVDHQSWSGYMDFPAGSLETLAGVVATTPEFLDDDDHDAGLYAEIEFGTKWAPFVEEFHEYIGLSITAQAYGEEMNAEGQQIIEGYVPSKLNTVDLVTVAGAKGELLRAVESYVETHGSITTDSSNTGKEGFIVNPEDIEKIVAGVTEAFTPLFNDLKESFAPAAEVTNPDENAEVVDIAAVAEAVATSGLPAPARAKVYAAVKEGAKADDAIATEKEYIKSVQEAANETVGRVQESVDASSKSYTVGGW